MDEGTDAVVGTGYVFKPWEELGWAFLTGAFTALLQVLVSFDPMTIKDWQMWAVTVGAGLIRAAAGSVIAVLTRKAVS